MKSNHIIKGLNRDNNILSTIEKLKVLDSTQLKSLFFPSKTGERICQRRLKTLTDKKKIKRDRLSIASPYYYFIKPCKQINHTIGVNWFYVYINRTLKNWESIYHWESEVDFKILRCDGFYSIKNNTNSKISFHFIEFDMASSLNHFDKIEKYNQLYQEQDNIKHWFLNYAEDFPTIHIITTNTNRIKHIFEQIKKENVNKLNFKVYLLDRIKEVLL